jgi:cysteine desulfurase/selenocysteine lyase
MQSDVEVECTSVGMASMVVGYDVEVPLLDGSRSRYVNLDNAATTPCLGAVQCGVNEFLRWYSSIHRGAGFKSILSTTVYEQAREVVAEFVGADAEANTVIFGRNTTEALNKLARRFPFEKGDVVLSSVMEHHSNLLPWRTVAQVGHIELRPDGSLDLQDLTQRLDAHAGRVKLVSITGASNVTGYLNPVHLIAKMAHGAGAKIAVDAAQLAGHRPIDVRPDGSADHLDFVALSAHKMYAPFGVGALIGPKSFFETGTPDEVGGGTVDFVTLDDVKWAGAPEREEAGSPNVVGAVALAIACRTLKRVGFETIVNHERELTRYLLERLKEVPRLKVFGLSDPSRAHQRLGVVSFAIDGIPDGLVASVLSCEGGIGVRSGCFCAHPYVLRLLRIPEEEAVYYRGRIAMGDRSEVPGLVRVSLGLHNSGEDIDRLIEILLRIARGQYTGSYVADKGSGLYRPQGQDLLAESTFQL